MNAHTDTESTTVLTEDVCWELLANAEVGRLVVTVDGRSDIFPVNFAVRDDSVYFLTAEGTKLADLTVHPEVAFESDWIGPDYAWSVVVHGRARALVHTDEIAAADELGIRPWVPGPKFNYVRIQAAEVSGRRFRILRD